MTVQLESSTNALKVQLESSTNALKMLLEQLWDSGRTGCWCGSVGGLLSNTRNGWPILSCIPC